MKLIEWNINKRSEDIISPSFVSERLLEQKADVICLVEYYKDSRIRSELMEKYWFEESIVESGNQVLIAVNKKYAPKGIEVVRNWEEKGCYNFLHVDFEDYLGNKLAIIGLRMLTGKGANRMNAEIQTPPLNKYLEDIKRQFVCVGDFNIIEKKMAYWFPNYKIQTIKESNEQTNKVSFFFPDAYNEIINNMVVLDHVLVRKDVQVEAEYSWDFLSDDGTYPYPDKSAIKVGNGYFEIKQGLPDHGMMICEIDY